MGGAIVYSGGVGMRNQGKPHGARPSATRCAPLSLRSLRCFFQKTRFARFPTFASRRSAYRRQGRVREAGGAGLDWAWRARHASALPLSFPPKQHRAPCPPPTPPQSTAVPAGLLWHSVSFTHRRSLGFRLAVLLVPRVGSARGPRGPRSPARATALVHHRSATVYRWDLPNHVGWD